MRKSISSLTSRVGLVAAGCGGVDLGILAVMMKVARRAEIESD